MPAKTRYGAPEGIICASIWGCFCKWSDLGRILVCGSRFYGDFGFSWDGPGWQSSTGIVLGDVRKFFQVNLNGKFFHSRFYPLSGTAPF
jgi:hypothetical protein